MKLNQKGKNEQVYIVLRRMREAAELTMREVGAMIGVSHVTISQFENGKLELPDYRIEQLVTAYGLTLESFCKILGRAPVVSPLDDCHAMIDRLDDNQLSAVRAILNQILRANTKESAAVPTSKVNQNQIEDEAKTA